MNEIEAQQENFITNQSNEMIDNKISDTSNFPIESEELISNDFIENVNVIKAPSKSISSESYVIDTKAKPFSNVKNRQRLAEKSCIARPKAARDKLTSRRAKPQMDLPHELGSMPKYMKKPTVSTKSSVIEVPSRSLTSDSVNSKLSDKSIKIDFKLTPKQEKQFQVSKSAPSTPNIQKSADEIEVMKKELTIKSNTIDRDKKQIQELKLRITSLKNQCENLKSELKNAHMELSDIKEKSIARDLQLVRLCKNEREEEKSKGKIDKLQNEIEILKKEKEDMGYDTKKMLKIKNNEIEELRKEIDELNYSLQEEKSSCEILSNENEKLKMSLGDKKCLEDGDKISSTENNELERLIDEIQKKVNELAVEKQNNEILTKEIVHLNSKLALLTNESITVEQMPELKNKIKKMKKHEEELCREMINLKNNLDIVKNDNESKNVLLEYRADHIKTLIDSESILKCRVATQLKEIQELREKLRGFDKFKLAHEEEKTNHNNTFYQKIRN